MTGREQDGRLTAATQTTLAQTTLAQTILAQTILALTMLALTACTSPESDAYPEPPQPRAQVISVPATLHGALPDPAGDFAGPEHDRLGAFLDAYRDGGRGPLKTVITAPDARTAGRAEAALRTLARRRGVVEEALAVTVTVAAGAPPGLTLAYTDFAVTPPPCNPEVVLSRTPTAAVSPNLGCALETSITATLAHPADYAAPTGGTPGDAARQSRVVTLYRQGKATEAEANRNDDLKASTISISK